MQLVKRHLILEECPAEFWLVVDIGHFQDGISLSGSDSVQLLGHRGRGLLEFIKQCRGDGQKVDAGKRFNLASLHGLVSISPDKKPEISHITERSAHDDGLVTVLLVVVEDFFDRLHTGVLIALVRFSGLVLLVPVEDAADERRDEGDAGFCAGDGLGETEEESEVTVDVMLALELTSGLDSLPRRCNFDKDTLLLDTDGLVEGDEFFGLEGA